MSRLDREALQIMREVHVGERSHYGLKCGVTVRVGKEGVYSCMTCHKVDCEHVLSVRRQLSKGTP